MVDKNKYRESNRQVMAYLDEADFQDLEMFSQITGESKAAIIRMALREYITRYSMDVKANLGKDDRSVLEAALAISRMGQDPALRESLSREFAALRTSSRRTLMEDLQSVLEIGAVRLKAEEAKKRVKSLRTKVVGVRYIHFVPRYPGAAGHVIQAMLHELYPNATDHARVETRCGQLNQRGYADFQGDLTPSDRRVLLEDIERQRLAHLKRELGEVYPALTEDDLSDTNGA